MASGDKTSVVMAPTSKAGNFPIFGENGQLADSGKKISDKADLEDGQVPYDQTNHLIALKKLYVNAATGNDNNTGTEASPFKTIQAAVNSIPKQFDRFTTVINVAEGVYNELVSITGFSGGEAYRPFVIKGSDAMDETRKVTSFRIANNSTLVVLEGLFVSGSLDAADASVGVSAATCRMSKLKIKHTDGKSVGISCGGNGPAQVAIDGCEIDGFPSKGIEASYASFVSVYKTTIKNCGVGINATGGVCCASSITNEGNSSNTSTNISGQIFGG